MATAQLGEASMLHNIAHLLHGVVGIAMARTDFVARLSYLPEIPAPGHGNRPTTSHLSRRLPEWTWRGQ